MKFIRIWLRLLSAWERTSGSDSLRGISSSEFFLSRSISSQLLAPTSLVEKQTFPTSGSDLFPRGHFWLRFCLVENATFSNVSNFWLRLLSAWELLAPTCVRLGTSGYDFQFSVKLFGCRHDRVYSTATPDWPTASRNILQFLPVWLSSCLPGFLLVCLSACLPVCLPVCLSACLPACLSVCLPVCLSLCLPVCLSACRLPVCLFACLPVCLSACLPVCLFACLCLPASLPLCLPVCL